MGTVYRLCEGLLARLPVDESGRRVFAETLADWRRELGTVGGVAAVGRAVSGVALKEAASQSVFRTWLRVTLWSAAWVVLGLGLSGVVYRYWNPSISTLAWSVSGVAFFLPVAILLSSLHRQTRVPVLGLSLTAALVAPALAGWVLPAANRFVFGDLVDIAFERPMVVGAQQVFQAVWPPLPLTYLSGRYAHELPALVAGGPPSGWAGLQMLSFTAAFVTVCMLMPAVASLLGRCSARSRKVAIALTVLVVLYQARVADVLTSHWVLGSFFAPWLPVLAMTAVLIASSRTLDRGLTSAKAAAGRPSRTLDLNG